MPHPAAPPLTSIPPDVLTLADYERRAEAHIAPATFAWLQGGSGIEQAVRDNRSAFDQWRIYNRVLVDCSAGTTATRVLGQQLAHPVMLAPLGYHRLVHAEGEVATARGALDTLMVVSTMATAPLDDITRAAAGPCWFQLYFQPDRQDTLRLVRQAEAAGCSAIMVTLDTPVQPASTAAQRAGFAMPPGVVPVLLTPSAPISPIRVDRGQSPIFQGMMAYAPTIADIAWLRNVTSLPLLAKGISHVDDAAMLIAAGVNGLVLSNHGGRALDGAPAPLAMLAGMRAALGPDATILIDGGIRTGGDVFKALALGADAVMVGRPQLHALAVAGSLGVAHLLKLLRAELELTMALAGCPTIAAITRAALCSTGEGVS